MIFFRKHFVVVLAGLVGLGFFSNCGNKHKKKDPRTVFRYNEMASVSSLDPAVATNFENIWAVNQLYNGLVQMNDSLKVLPCIAKKWSISEDGLIYTFTLRKDVYFHDNELFKNGKGRQVTARDFVFSFNRLFDSKVSSAMSLLDNVNRAIPGTKNGFEAKNDSTFVVYMKEAFSPFIGILTMKFFSVVAREAVEKYGEDFRRNPIGTGPFKFKFWEEGNQLVLIKNKNYFEFDGTYRLPYLDAVAVSFIKDKETAFMQFIKGDVDMLSGMDAFNPTEVLDEEGKLKPFYKNKFKLQSQPYLKTDYFGILIDENIDFVKNSPLKNKALRKAINYAFDRVKLVKYFRNNTGVPATAGFIPSGLPAYNPKKVIGYTYNPDKVKEMLVEAGYPDGKGLPEITLHSTANYVEVLEFFQSQLAENGIKIKISIDNDVELKKAVANNNLTFFKKSWICDYADEENFMSLFYSKNFSPKGFNYTHYSNPDFDKLYEQAKTEQNDSIRIDLYQRMDQMVMDDAPIIPIYYDQVIRIVGNNISNLGTNSMNLLNLKRVKKQNVLK